MCTHLYIDIGMYIYIIIYLYLLRVDESSSKIGHPRNGSASAVAGCVTHANTRPGPVRRVGPGTRLGGLAAYAQSIGRKAEAAGVHPPGSRAF